MRNLIKGLTVGVGAIKGYPTGTSLGSTHQNAFTSGAARNRRVTATVLATLGGVGRGRGEGGRDEGQDGQPGPTDALPCPQRSPFAAA